RTAARGLYRFTPSPPRRSSDLPLLTLPAESSIRCAVSVGVVPFQFAAGRNRTEVPAARTRAVASVRLVAMPTHCEVVVLNHCHMSGEHVSELQALGQPACLLAL